MSIHKKAVFAAGCFWGVEEKFRKLEGVLKTKVGYTGGVTDKPTYESVCAGETKHAEAIEVVYDPDTINYRELVGFFFKIHDPSTKDRQGFDIGSQYRSAIFFVDEEQKKIAEEEKEKVEEKEGIKVSTIITKSTTFFDAEDYHQKYIQKKSN